MKGRLLTYLCLISLITSCDSYVPYPVLAEDDALIRLQCTIEEADSAVVYVSKEYMITHDHRPSTSGKEQLNSLLKFVVNGDELEYRVHKGSTDIYTVYHSFQAGDVVEVFCSAPGLPDVSAKTTVPEIPQDFVKEFSYTVEDNVLKGKILVDFERYNNLHLSAFLDISELVHRYIDGILDESTYYHGDRFLSPTGHGEWVFDYQLPTDYVGTDEEGKVVKETTETCIGFKLQVLSDELYFARLHQQSSPMSPSSYTNVKGGLGYVGAINRVVIDTFKSDAQ